MEVRNSLKYRIPLYESLDQVVTGGTTRVNWQRQIWESGEPHVEFPSFLLQINRMKVGFRECLGQIEFSEH